MLVTSIQHSSNNVAQLGLQRLMNCGYGGITKPDFYISRLSMLILLYEDIFWYLCRIHPYCVDMLIMASSTRIDDGQVLSVLFMGTKEGYWKQISRISLYVGLGRQ
jgi:hypothetical protein